MTTEGREERIIKWSCSYIYDSYVIFTQRLSFCIFSAHSFSLSNMVGSRIYIKNQFVLFSSAAFLFLALLFFTVGRFKHCWVLGHLLSLPVLTYWVAVRTVNWPVCLLVLFWAITNRFAPWALELCLCVAMASKVRAFFIYSVYYFTDICMASV